MGFSKEKRKIQLFCAVAFVLFLGCFFPDLNAAAREKETYTSVTVEFRDADTGEIFHTYVHPWQREGKRYTYYMEEKIYQEGKGCYWYDESHEGTIAEIISLSKKAEENRIVLYYKLYDMGEEEYAVNVTYKDADTEEVIRTDVLFMEKWPGQYYSGEKSDCIVLPPGSGKRGRGDRRGIL